MADKLKLVCPLCGAKKDLDVSEGVPFKTVCLECKKPFGVKGLQE